MTYAGQFEGPTQPPDLSGEWRRLTGHEDAPERLPGPELGEYWGLPLNDAARLRADSHNAQWLSTSTELQCRPHPTGFQQLGPDLMRITKEWNPLTREVFAYQVLYQRTPGARMIYLDGRSRPSRYAAHTWEGFALGRWEGDTLSIETSHLKESFVRRNGVPASPRRTVTEYVSLEEPYLMWVLVVNDPDYLTEPLVRSATYVRAPAHQVPVYPCAPQIEDVATVDRKDFVPHYLPGANPYLSEVAVKYQVALEAVRGGAETLYPEYQPKAKSPAAPKQQFAFAPDYGDASTHIAERATAESGGGLGPSVTTPEWLHVQGHVYLVAGAGSNIAVSAGADGALLVDAGSEQMSDRVLTLLEQIGRATSTVHPLASIESAHPFASTSQAAHSPAPPAIRMIINTTADLDHVGGNAAIASSTRFRPIGLGDVEQSQSEVIVAHQNVLTRLEEAMTSEKGWPQTTYFTDRYRIHRFFNGEGVEIYHLPNAHSDGDSMIYFRKSDVVVTGDVFDSEAYPVIDVEHDGSVQGVIDALIRITELAYPEYMSQGGTMVVPGHGRAVDSSEVAYYRDMLIIIRDRIQDLIKKGMTLEQVKAAKPTMDYDPVFGRRPGATARFVEAVYASLTKSSASGRSTVP